MTTQDLKDSRQEIIDEINSMGLQMFTKEIMMDMIKGLSNPYIDATTPIELLKEMIELGNYEMKMLNIDRSQRQELFNQQMRNQMNLIK